ncbi:hypothetical protein [Labrenzia sp. PHM005]|uniref:hypothetical protein n=1 Tax=Labrenzia sp. PHM005 TaxID=2590016 RepID=UPI001AD8D707|nr:hypothetical protein [Labrenzia sp. PHM005]
MAKERQGLWGRLIRLPGQLLLALINATALLVIAASVLALLVLHQVEEAGTRVAGAVTGATLARLQVTPAEFKDNLENLDDRVQEISEWLQSPSLKADPELKRQLTELNANLVGLREAADGIRSAGPDITSAAFEQAGDLLTDALHTLRGCGVPTSVVIQEGITVSSAQLIQQR